MRIRKIAIPGLLLLLLANIGCRKEETFDIRGTWSFRAGSEEVVIFSFSGTFEKGTLIYPDHENLGMGSYTVSEKEVVFDFISTSTGGASYHFHGLFISENRLSGTINKTAPYPPFDWTLEVEIQRL